MKPVQAMLVAGAVWAVASGAAAADRVATAAPRTGVTVGEHDVAADAFGAAASIRFAAPRLGERDGAFDRGFGFPGDAPVAAVAPVDPCRSLAGRLPEPASWAMMILGIGMVGHAVRRRVRASEHAFDARIRRIAAGEDV